VTGIAGREQTDGSSGSKPSDVTVNDDFSDVTPASSAKYLGTLLRFFLSEETNKEIKLVVNNVN
jgi:hypothetical protein